MQRVLFLADRYFQTQYGTWVFQRKKTKNKPTLLLNRTREFNVVSAGHAQIGPKKPLSFV